MSESKARLLRNRAAALRTQAATGELVAVAVREVVQDVPREMRAMVSEQLQTGALIRRFTDEHQRALREGLADGDAIPAALSGVLVSFTREVQASIVAKLEALDAARERALGRAAGIDEALRELTPEGRLTIIDTEAHASGD